MPIPALPSITANRPPPLRAASIKACSVATCASRSRSKKAAPPEGTTFAEYRHDSGTDGEALDEGGADAASVIGAAGGRLSLIPPPKIGEG